MEEKGAKIERKEDGMRKRLEEETVDGKRNGRGKDRGGEMKDRKKKGEKLSKKESGGKKWK